MITRKCIVCGKDIRCYKSTVDKKKYCSKECYIKDHFVYVKCLFCNKEYLIAKTKYSGKFIGYKCCSIKCYNSLKRRKKDIAKESIRKNCLMCGKEFFRRNYNKLMFCSQKCSSKYMRGDKSPFYKNGSTITNGYKTININGKYVYEHRYIVEKLIGKKLKSDEVVHHIDGNKLNNKIENLKIMNKIEHDRFHTTIRRNNGEFYKKSTVSNNE